MDGILHGSQELASESQVKVRLERYQGGSAILEEEEETVKYTNKKDQGCADARNLFGYSGKCISCPIKPECLEVVKETHKKLANYLMHMAILKLLKKGASTLAINKRLHTNRRVVAYVRKKYLKGVTSR